MRRNSLHQGLWVLALLVPLAAGNAAAQIRAGQVVGVVRDELGNGIPQVTVVLDSADLSRHASTDSLGRFSIAGVDTGAHLIRAVKIGFTPAERRFVVPARGAFIELEMARLTQLEPITVVAERSGIFGKVIARGGFSPLAEATVTIIGAHTTGRTSGTGDFDLPTVPPGSYLVRVQRRGYESRMLSVIVPDRGGIELSVTLTDTQGVDRELRMASLLNEADSRARFRGTTSAIVPRQELSGRYDLPLGKALRYSPAFLLAGLVLNDSITCVFVNGLPVPNAVLDDYSAGEIVSVEVYGLRQDRTSTLAARWPKGAHCGLGFDDSPESSDKFGLQGGARSGRIPMDNVARAVVIWTNQAQRPPE